MPKFVRYAALAIALLAAAMWMKQEQDAEACREAGGRWDAAANACATAAPAAGATPG